MIKTIKDIYKFLHDNYDREKWGFVHHFVYTFTVGLFLASLVALMATTVSVIICAIASSPKLIILAIAAVFPGLLAVLSWSLLAWIDQ